MNLVEYVIKFTETGAGKAIDGARAKMERLDASIKAVNQRLSSFESFVAGAGLVALGAGIVKVTSDFERYEAVLTNTFQSSEKALQAMAMINDVAASTPFNIDELNKAYIKLANQGLVLTRQQIIALGDTASFSGKGFDQLAEAILDARQGEFERLRELNISAKRAGDDVIFTFRNVATRVKFTSKNVEEYLLSLGKLQGVTGGMAAISKTLGGQISNLQDSVLILAAEIGQALRPSIVRVIEALKNLVNWVSGIKKSLDGTLFSFGNMGKVLLLVAGYIAALVVAVKVATAAQWLWNTAMSANPIGLVVLAVGALVAGLAYLYNNVDQVKWAFDSWFNSVKSVAYALNVLLGPAITQLGRGLAWVVDRYINNINAAILSLRQNLISIINFFEKLALFDWQKQLAANLKASLELKIRGRDGSTSSEDPSLEGPSMEGPTVTPSTAGPSATGTSATVSSAAPRQFNINIENLVRQFTVSNNSTIQASAEEVKMKMEQALMEAVADVQIAR